MVQEDKFTSRAESIPADKYRWRPTPDVRSFAEVFLPVRPAHYNLSTNWWARLLPLGST